MLTIKVLGPGCDNCVKVEAVARQAVAHLGLDAHASLPAVELQDDHFVTGG